MNIHSTDVSLRDSLEKSKLSESTFGSHLYGLNHANSDRDVFIIYNDSCNMRSSSLKVFNNIQFKENNTDYVYCSLSSFVHDLLNGGSTVSFEVLHLLEGTKLDWFYQNREFFYTIDNVRSYLGIARRDCKLYKENFKKLAHAYRSLEFAKSIVDHTFQLRFNDDRYETLRELLFGERNDKLRKELMDSISAFREKVNESDTKRTLTVDEYRRLDSEVDLLMNTNARSDYIDLGMFYEAYVAGGVVYEKGQ